MTQPAFDKLTEGRHSLGNVTSLFDSAVVSSAAAVNSVPQMDVDEAVVIFDVSAAGGVLSLVNTIEALELDAAGKRTWNLYHSFAALVGNGKVTYILGTAGTPSIATVNMDAPIPSAWRFTMTEGSAFSSTVRATIHRMTKV